MGTYYRAPRRTMSFGGFTLTPAVKILLVINAALYIFPEFFSFTPYNEPLWMALRPSQVLHGMIWQPLTYMFFHGSISHFLFNMLTLWMFGTAVEQTWGTRRFTFYYLACGVFAGLTVVATNLAVYLSASPFATARALAEMNIATIGSSGAIFGLILAFGLLFPDAPVLLFFLFPIPAKYFAILMGFIEFFLQRTSPGSGVSHWAHLGGMLFGVIYIKLWMPRHRQRPAFRPRFRAPVFEDEEPQKPAWWRFDIVGAYRRWKLRRARKKFEVYMRKNRGDDRWIQ